MRKIATTSTLALIAATVTSCAGADVEPDDTSTEEVESAALPVVGGHPANVVQWPWIVSLNNSNGSQFCGGSLVTPSWVLTAAHCSMPATIRVGPVASSAVSRNVSQRIVHPGYDANTYENDLALLQLSHAVTGIDIAPLNLDLGFPYVTPLTSTSTTSDSANVMVAGWGDTAEGGSGSATLLEASIPAITTDSCVNAYANYPVTVFPYDLCAGYQGGGVDTCDGDSGGPLTFSFGRPLLAGVTSRGWGCARSMLPGVYTRVSNHIDWITQHVMNAKTISPTAIIVAATAG